MKLQPRKRKPILKRIFQLICCWIPFGAAVLTLSGCSSEQDSKRLPGDIEWDEQMSLRGKIVPPYVDSSETNDSVKACDSTAKDTNQQVILPNKAIRLGGVARPPIIQ